MLGSAPATVAFMTSSIVQATVGGTVEVLPHPSLSRQGGNVFDLGWQPAEVDAVGLGLPFPRTSILDKLPRPRDLQLPNSRKLALTGIATDPTRSKLELELRNTDFFTTQTISRGLSSHPDVRREYESLDPARSLIPHSFALHYLVVFRDGSLLCCQRSDRTAYHPRHWSFSAEEQMNPDDLEHDRPFETLMRRALLEEVFPLHDVDSRTLDERWRLVDRYVSSMRLWSVIVETPIWHFSTFGVFLLALTPPELVQFSRELRNRRSTFRDSDGAVCVIRPHEVRRLLTEGCATAREIDTGDVYDIDGQMLHPSSRYRLVRYVRALNASR